MPELLWQLAADLNFTFEFLEPEDKKFGGYHPGGSLAKLVLSDLRHPWDRGKI